MKGSNGESGKVEGTNNGGMRGFPEPQMVECAKASNEAGSTGPRSPEEHLEDLRLFGLGKTQRDFGFCPQTSTDQRKQIGSRWSQGAELGPRVKPRRQRSAQHRKKKKKKLWRFHGCKQHCFETLCSRLLKLGDRNCSNTWRGNPSY